MAGGSEWRTLSLFNLLSPHAEVKLWSEDLPHARLAEQFPIHRIDTASGDFPRTGVLVFVGFYRVPGVWVEQARPDRVVLICNTPNYGSIRPMQRALRTMKVPTEYVYASEDVRRGIGEPGPIQPSPIDLDRFHPASWRLRTRWTFRVGRMSRDHLDKHHLPDAALYRRWADAGCRVSIMGGSVLRDAIGEHPRIELSRAGTEPAADFLRKLDCFYYRTCDAWYETYGRVVAEAMATGLPVVAHHRGGYADFIQHGVDGLLFSEEAEAHDCVLALRRDPARRAALGKAARASMERLHGPEGQASLVRYYLEGV